MSNAVLFSGTAGLITIAGVFGIKLWHAYALRYSHYINSFAAGLMLTAALAVLLPRAIHQAGHDAAVWALGGFIFFLCLETLLVFHSGAEIHYEQGRGTRARGMVFFWGLFVHSLLDGVIIAIGFAGSFRLGLVASLAVISHELPEGITTFSLLLDKLKDRAAFRLSLAVAFATPLGGLGGALLLPLVPGNFIGAAIGLVAGSFLYIAATDIVPEIREKHAARNIACMTGGMVFLLVTHHFLAH